MRDEWRSLARWSGELDRYDRPVPSVVIRAPLQRARSSGAGAFLALADDGRSYWVKVPGNAQGNQVLVNEVIVAELGAILGAPTRERILVAVPPSVTEWSKFPARSSPVALLAHASLHVPHAEDSDDLHYTKRDDNRRRQAALAGLWDLCVGEDEQWLYDSSAAYSIWSYDHGFWFTTGEGDWNAEVLQRLLDVANELKDLPSEIDRTELDRVAGVIEALTPEQLLGVMSAVPVEWGTSDRDLEAMAWFLFNRREAVAFRLRRIASASSGQT